MTVTGQLDRGSLELPGSVRLPLEIRVHGRGGQGGVTCAKLIAALFARLGLAVQTFGDYGSERSGAPVQAFTRVDRLTVTNRNKVYRPDHLLVLDPGLLATPVLSGVAPGALILVNSPCEPDELDERYRGFRVATVGATQIAREKGIGSATVIIVNTTMVGAYARLLDLPLTLLEEVYASFGIADDLPAAELAYQAVKLREPDASAPVELAPVPEGSAAPVEPIYGPARDLPVQLVTGLWSNQSPGYRTFTAPCSAACPAGNDVVGFVQALKEGGPEAAAAVLLRTQALPSVCGRVCPAPCMGDCNRRSFDGAVNIRSLERFIADNSVYSLEKQMAKAPRSFAVVGGGPAGLSAAYQLALRGHEVTLFDSHPALGGVLRYGIPAFRLPLEALERDLFRILSLGIGVRLGASLGPAQLLGLSAEFDALIVCTGFGDPHLLGVPGEELSGVEQGLPFLDRVKQAAEPVGGQVVVVGGGNTAIDCARTALRLGAQSVRLVYRRSREDMPAIAEEIAEAESEGVRLMTLRQPVAFLGEGRLEALVLAEVEPGSPDGSGRRRPVVTERTVTVPCDRVILALGQGDGLELVPAEWQVKEGRAYSGERPLPVFFAGDCATGDGTVTHAVGNGRRSALAALAAIEAPEALLRPGALEQSAACPGRTEPLAAGADPAERGDAAGADSCSSSADPPMHLRAASLPAGDPGPVVAPAQIRFSHFELARPARDRHLSASAARESFQEFNQGLAGPEEAQRCFSCGKCTRCDTCLVYCPDGVIKRSEEGYRVDLEHCKGCGMCVAECPRCAMEMHEKEVPGGER